MFGNVEIHEMDDLDFHESWNAKTTKGTSVRRWIQPTVDDEDDARARNEKIDIDEDLFNIDAKWKKDQHQMSGKFVPQWKNTEFTIFKRKKFKFEFFPQKFEFWIFPRYST